MDTKTIVTNFFRNTTLEDRRKLNHRGIFTHNVEIVANIVARKLEGSSLTLNFTPEIVDIISQKILVKSAF